MTFSKLKDRPEVKTGADAQGAGPASDHFVMSAAYHDHRTRCSGCVATGLHVRETRSMLRNLFGPIAMTFLLLSATATLAAPVQGKRHVARRWHGYGFLPGYRSAE